MSTMNCIKNYVCVIYQQIKIYNDYDNIINFDLWQIGNILCMIILFIKTESMST